MPTGYVITTGFSFLFGFGKKYNRCSAYVAISEADRDPTLDYLATIHHGIDTDAFALHPDPGGYLLFFGRIHPDKGTATAISVAARAGSHTPELVEAALPYLFSDDLVLFQGAIAVARNALAVTTAISPELRSRVEQSLISAAGNLGRAPGKINARSIVLDGHAHANRDFAVADTVIIQGVLRPVGAIRDRGNRAAHHAR